MCMTWNCQDDSVFMREAIREAVEATGLAEKEIFPHTNRLRESIVKRSQELKAEYNRETSLEVLR